ncbi:hypothetical protein M758_1G200400 [Ceratodon purpureus]|nr:hypothetical protein M758_1G200400 [Ceratodon purpureus]KAG0630730.1 hypothetical protein M758_1G200400 [Ceratodon purpureus]
MGRRVGRRGRMGGEGEEGFVKRPANPAIAKTSLCSYFRKKGCNHGENCKFAHGESELQMRPDGTWDPTSERCKKKEETEEGEDAKGDESRYRKCLVNVPMNWSQQKLKSFLDQNGVRYSSAQKRKSMKVCFMGFNSQEQLSKSAEILDGMPCGNKRLKLADVLPRAWEQKAVGVTEAALAGDKEEEDNNDGEDNPMVEDGSGDENEKKTLEPYRNVTQVVTPLADLSYEDQLAKKKEEIIQILKRLARNIRKGCPSGMLLPDWLAAAKDREGLPCEFEGILPSPVVEGYRNKCEFAIGLGPDGKNRVVGFQLGSFREGINAVAEPGECRNVSSVALNFVAAFQTFIRASKLPVWNKTDNTGFWRMLTIREGREPGSVDEIGKEIAEVMLVVQVCPTGVPEDRAKEEYSKMAKALVEAATTATPQLPLTALLVQEHVGVSNSAPADCPLHALPLPGLEEIHNSGKPLDEPLAHIHDYIGTSKFRISPTAFFQVNSAGAEKLYSLAGDWAGLGPDTLLFDVCCGTGAIGLTLAKRVGMVVGIEMNASAVADAQLNADLNGIKNCRFICGKAEDVISKLLKEYAIDGPDEPEQTAAPEAGKGEEGGDEQASPVVEGSVKQEEDKRPRFKNIVAIVDPPRVGLHHVVSKGSCFPLILCSVI